MSRALIERSFATYGLPLRRVLAHAAAGTLAFRFVAAELLLAAVRASEYVPFCQLRRLPVAE